MSETSDHEHTAAEGQPSLRSLLDTWSQWSGRDTFEQAARRAEAAGDHAHAARLREFAADEAAVSATEALAAQHEVASLLAGWEWQTMRAAREEGATWAQIARAVDTDPVAARDAYLARVDRQEAAAAEYGWSFGVTAEQAREYRAVAGDWVDQLRPDVPAHVRDEIGSAVARDDAEALAELQSLWWDPDRPSVPIVDTTGDGLDDEPVPYRLTADAHEHLDADRSADGQGEYSNYTVEEAVTALTPLVGAGDAREAVAARLREHYPQMGPNPYGAVFEDTDLVAIEQCSQVGPSFPDDYVITDAGEVVGTRDPSEWASTYEAIARARDVVGLECPECGEDAVEQPPVTTVPYPAHATPVPRYAHPDGEPLCPVVGPSGYQPAEPREVLDDETARREQLTQWHSDDQAAAHGSDDGMQL